MSVVHTAVAALVVAALGAPAPQSAGPDPAQTTQPVVVTIEDGGFQWEAAGLGAVGGAAASLLVCALAVALRRPAERTQGGEVP